MGHEGKAPGTSGPSLCSLGSAAQRRPCFPSTRPSCSSAFVWSLKGRPIFFDVTSCLHSLGNKTESIQPQPGLLVPSLSPTGKLSAQCPGAPRRARSALGFRRVRESVRQERRLVLLQVPPSERAPPEGPALPTRNTRAAVSPAQPSDHPPWAGLEAGTGLVHCPVRFSLLFHAEAWK